MKIIGLCLLLLSSTIQASSFQEYCSNAMGTVKIARGHIANEISVTERIPKDWAFVDQKIVLPDAFVGVLESQQLEGKKETVCEGKWGVFYWKNVFYRKVRVVQPDGSLFSSNVVGVSTDKSFVETAVICEEHGNSETMCEDAEASVTSDLRNASRFRD
ncbi:MAG TPA: hypothetical protein VFO10_24515 [Oligoflexus sp.]|uniref:hypothetical protein n=1 Tax=Oligoflexus sp. TaxID=1971216 RepID=UPI002D7EAEFF|nr:hypothetical protein [Oligoflexus sp.]HET9240451.1 hypothetical protein [Oligoflexus sp.]